MGWKKMILGEKMPDKDDPKYRQRYENEVNAGRNFAKVTRIDKLAGCIQKFANNHQKLFLALVFGFVLITFGFNIYRMVTVYRLQQEPTTATQRQEKLMEERHLKIQEAINSAHCVPNCLVDRDSEKTNKEKNEDNGCTKKN